MKELVLLKDEFEVKAKLCDLLSEVTFGQAEAICYALDKLDELSKLKDELEFTRTFIHNNGLEWDLLSKYKDYYKSKGE